MKNTYEEAVLKVVMWWSDKAFRTPMNQDNGADSDTGFMTFMLMNILSDKAQEKVTEEQIRKFEDKLTELLMKASCKWERDLDVDYHPCSTLVEAAIFAGIDCSCFPCKSWTQIREDNRVFAKYKYGGDSVEL
ncbi:MAG: hypothetical protein EHM34_03355 [Nitrosopumilales archaeon]|nr:MAG: hypothetical protein EHM34_03355 [Nitrosopumilales archaeon]